MSAIVLASASPTRKWLLERSGIQFEVMAPSVDEVKLKSEYPDLNAGALALKLAHAKANTVSQLRPSAIVIGSDQVAVIDNIHLEKPRDLGEAFHSLSMLQGRWHQQFTATCLYRDQRCIWDIVEVARLKCRSLTETAIWDYLEQDKPIGCVGAYRFESAGFSLFEEISGEDDVIQGFNLRALLQALNELK